MRRHGLTKTKGNKMTSNIRKHLKQFVLIFALLLSVTSIYSTQAQAQAPLVSSTCDPQILERQKTRAELVTQRNTQIAQSIITKPDASANMVCLGEQFIAAAGAIGKIFSDNAAFAGSCPGGSMTEETLSSIANTMLLVVDAGYALGGGTLNINYDTVQRMLIAGAANAIGGQVAAIVAGWIPGGSCITQIAESVIGAAIDTVFGGDVCDLMNQVWEGVALGNARPEWFKTIRELQDSSNDPRQTAGGGGTPLPFAHTLATVLFAEVADLDAQDLISNGAFASADMNLNAWGPYSTTGTCTALPMFGPFISCNPGCKVSGSYPTWSCVPGP